MPKFGGWRRLWVVLSLVYLLVVVYFAWVHFPTGETDQFGIAFDHMKNWGAVVMMGEAFKDKSDESHPTVSVTTPQGHVLTFLERDATTFSANLKEVMAEYDRAVRTEQRFFILKEVLLWLGPVIALYLFGLAVRWIYRGFRPVKQPPPDSP